MRIQISNISFVYSNQFFISLHAHWIKIAKHFPFYIKIFFVLKRVRRINENSNHICWYSVFLWIVFYFTISITNISLLYPSSFSPLEGTRILFVFSGLFIVNLELKFTYIFLFFLHLICIKSSSWGQSMFDVYLLGLPRWLSGKESNCQWRCGFDP